MDSFVNYIVESGISLGIFSTIYFLFLRKETFFRLNRFFLLSALSFSILLPLLRFRVYTPKAVELPEITVTPYANLLESISVYGSSVSGNIASALSTSQWVVIVYLAGILFFAIRFSIRLLQIKKIIRQGKLIKKEGIRYVLVKRKINPFSFLNFVFVSDDFESQSEWEKIIQHELEHVRQGHSFDVLVLEILSAFQWFNPFFWMLKRAVKENHEFLADHAVITNSGNVLHYKQLLLKQVVGGQLAITNNFNYSLIKSRVKMMSRIKSSKIANIKLLSGVLIAVALIIVFACEQKEFVEIEKVPTGHTLSLQLDSEKIRLEGNPESIEQLKKILATAPNIEMETFDGGDIVITQKSQNVDELVVVAHDKEEPVEQEEVFFIVEEMPEFPGGDLELRKFIASSIKYPVVAQENGIQGKVYVSFVVKKDGSIGRARVVRGVDPSLDTEALRVVRALPKWIPGRQRGKQVAVSYTVPINFVLQ